MDDEYVDRWEAAEIIGCGQTTFYDRCRNLRRYRRGRHVLFRRSDVERLAERMANERPKPINELGPRARKES